jgi:hypothetical protein
MIEINKNPSRKDLNVFGLLLALFVGVIGLLTWKRTHTLHAQSIIWLVGAAVVVLFFILRPLQKPLYLGWMYAAYPIGWVVSHIIMSLAFYLAVVPVALIMRAMGKDPMQRQFDRSATSYWVPREQVQDLKQYFRQF